MWRENNISATFKLRQKIAQDPKNTLISRKPKRQMGSDGAIIFKFSFHFCIDLMTTIS